MNTYLVDINRCSGRGLCASAGPKQAIRVVAKQARILADRCNQCGTCLTISKRIAIQAANMSIPPFPVTIDRPLIRQTCHRARRQRWRTAHARLLNPAGSYPREDAS